MRTALATAEPPEHRPQVFLLDGTGANTTWAAIASATYLTSTNPLGAAVWWPQTSARLRLY